MGNTDDIETGSVDPLDKNDPSGLKSKLNEITAGLSSQDMASPIDVHEEASKALDTFAKNYEVIKSFKNKLNELKGPSHGVDNNSNEYIKVQQGPSGFLRIEIGRDPEITKMWQDAFDLVNKLEEKTTNFIVQLVRELEEDEINSSITSGPTASIQTIAATPSKTVPKRNINLLESTTKCVMVLNNKKLANTASKKRLNSTSQRSNTSLASTKSSSSTARKGNRSKKKLSGRLDYAEPSTSKAEQSKLIRAHPELMTETSIDPLMSEDETITPTRGKPKPLIIALEPSISSDYQPNIVDSSESTLVIKTRSRTRMETVTKSVATKPTVTSTSSAKSSKTRAGTASGSAKKAQPPTSASKTRVNISASTSRLNQTPSKAAVSNLATAGRGSAKKTQSVECLANSRGVRTNASALKTADSDSSIQSTPVKRSGGRSPSSSMTRATAINTPQMAAKKRQEIELERQQRLINSVDKAKKAEENKKLYLNSRTERVKNDREKRMEKINQNKLTHEENEQKKQRFAHLLADPSAEPQQDEPPANKPMTKAELQRAERKRRLVELEAKQKARKEKELEAAQNADKPATIKGPATKKAKPTRGKQQTKNVEIHDPQVDNIQVNEEKMLAENHSQEPSLMSPIKKVSDIGNGKLNLTFTANAPMQNATTIVNSITASESPFIKPNGPAPKTPKPLANSTFNMSKKILNIPQDTLQASTPQVVKPKGPTSYEMTPPPRERTYDYEQYEISKYIDSDNEEEIEAAERERDRGDKHIPQWAKGTAFLTLVRAQFDKPQEEQDAIARTIFSKPLLPVPLEEMGLKVREKYATRSSSVNWKKAEDIAQEMKALEAKDKLLRQNLQ